MFGFTSSGCFIVGIIIGFIAAALLAVGSIFYFKPDIKAQVLSRVEQIWGDVKSNVDNSIEVVKKAPVAEPVLEQSPPKAPAAPPGGVSGTRQSPPFRSIRKTAQPQKTGTFR